jgi:hypothetical protein
MEQSAWRRNGGLAGRIATGIRAGIRGENAANPRQVFLN